ncbi:GNAT family N-acetyltransferase [candidate division KSB1 bacterium]
MSIELEIFKEKLSEEWDNFVEHSDNGTIFNTRKFLNYHEKGKFTDASLIFRNKGKIYALMPAVIREVSGEKILFSHPGASYGGLVFSETNDLKKMVEVVKTVDKHAKKIGCDRIILTQTPIYYYGHYNSYVDFALHTSGFNYKVRELSSVLSLEHSEEEIFNTFPENVKRAIRKAEKSGVIIKKSKNTADFYKILKNNLEMRHDVRPTHTLKELKQLVSIFPDKIELFAAYLEDKMIGGVITFTCNRRVVLAFYIAHDHSFQKYRPVDLIIWSLIQELTERNVKFLDFGTFTLRMEPNWGLCRFKEKFGARGVFRDTFERRI